MKIYNIMLGAKKGGVEQMALTYTHALINNKYEVTCVVDASSPYINQMKELGANIHVVKNKSLYNIFGMIKLLKKMNQDKADIAILHGNRAVAFVTNKIAQFFAKPLFKTCVVGHSVKLKYNNRLDSVIYIAQKSLHKQHKNAFYLPNTIYEKQQQITPIHTPLVFGSMGRLHVNKGYDLLMPALALLKEKGYQFKFILGGVGPEEDNLKQQVKNLNLCDTVTFYGWVDDKIDFFNQIDVFCLSSRHETFGLVILEAFAYFKPVVSFATQGPSEILSYLSNPLIASNENVTEFASKLEYVLTHPDQIHQMAVESNQVYIEKYGSDYFEQQLKTILQKINTIA